MLETIEFEIRGISPLLMHNGQLADPENHFSVEMKKITDKGKNKTDSDREELRRLEFMGGLYIDENQHPIVPGQNIEMAIVDAARTERKGQIALRGIMSDGNWPVKYDGPKTPDELFADKRFVDVRSVVNPSTRSRVMRCRAKFRDWSLTFSVQFDPSHCNRQQVIRWVHIMGKDIGMCDYTPKFGRSEVIFPKEEVGEPPAKKRKKPD